MIGLASHDYQASDGRVPQSEIRLTPNGVSKCHRSRQHRVQIPFRRVPRQLRASMSSRDRRSGEDIHFHVQVPVHACGGHGCRPEGGVCVVRDDIRSPRWHHYTRWIALALKMGYQIGLYRGIFVCTTQAAICPKPQRSRSVSSIHSTDSEKNFW